MWGHVHTSPAYRIISFNYSILCETESQACGFGHIGLLIIMRVIYPLCCHRWCAVQGGVCGHFSPFFVCFHQCFQSVWTAFPFLVPLRQHKHTCGFKWADVWMHILLRLLTDVELKQTCPCITSPSSLSCQSATEKGQGVYVRHSERRSYTG